MTKLKLSDYRLMASLVNVPRWGTTPNIRRTTVAQHSFEVVWTSEWLYFWMVNGQYLDPDPTLLLGVLRHAMRHDKVEGATGDNPSPVKRLGWIVEDKERIAEHVSPDTTDPMTLAIVKAADRLCMYRDALAELGMGNTFYRSLSEKCLSLALDKITVALGAPGVFDPVYNNGMAVNVVEEYIRECPALIGISHDIETALEE